MTTSEPTREGPAASRSTELAARDLSLVQEALNGTPSAVGEIARRMDCIPIFLAHHNKQLGRPIPDSDLEDLARNVVLAVWKRLDTFRGLARFETWIYRFCEYAITNFVRKSSPPIVSLDTTEVPEPAASDATSLARGDAEAVWAAIEQLDAREAAVLNLKYFDDLSLGDIAQRLQISIHMVKRAHIRGLQRLETLLGASFGPESP